jgi:hypothetical protein
VDDDFVPEERFGFRVDIGEWDQRVRWLARRKVRNSGTTRRARASHVIIRPHGRIRPLGLHVAVAHGPDVRGNAEGLGA